MLTQSLSWYFLNHTDGDLTCSSEESEDILLFTLIFGTPSILWETRRLTLHLVCRVRVVFIPAVGVTCSWADIAPCSWCHYHQHCRKHGTCHCHRIETKMTTCVSYSYHAYSGAQRQRQFARRIFVWWLVICCTCVSVLFTYLGKEKALSNEKSHHMGIFMSGRFIDLKISWSTVLSYLLTRKFARPVQLYFHNMWRTAVRSNSILTRTAMACEHQKRLPMPANRRSLATETPYYPCCLQAEKTLKPKPTWQASHIL